MGFKKMSDHQKLNNDRKRQEGIAKARQEKGLKLTKLYLDQSALESLQKLAHENGYEKILSDRKNEAGKIDEVSALVSFCLRYVASTYRGKGQISIKCQEYYQTHQVALHIKQHVMSDKQEKNKAVSREKERQYVVDELNRLQLRTKEMIINGADYEHGSWDKDSVNRLLDEDRFKKDMREINPIKKDESSPKT